MISARSANEDDLNYTCELMKEKVKYKIVSQNTRESM